MEVMTRTVVPHPEVTRTVPAPHLADHALARIAKCFVVLLLDKNTVKPIVLRKKLHVALLLGAYGDLTQFEVLKRCMWGEVHSSFVEVLV